jgi:ribosomal protein S18 acetylase RimI-like enzyme
MIEVKAAGFRDIPAIYNIELRSFEYPYAHGNLQQILELAGACPFIGKYGERGVSWGFGVHHIEDAEMDVKRIGTHPAYRQKGFARTVIGHIWNEAVKRQCKKITMVVPEYQMDPDDIDSIFDFAWKMGLRATGLEKEYFYRYGRKYDGIKLERAT